MSFRFYLGHVDSAWLSEAGVPMLFSLDALGKAPPRATAGWALDSGAFSELRKYGKWRTGVPQFVERVRWALAAVGPADFVGPQDWMCSPAVLAATGLSMEEHQARTVENLLQVRAAAPEVPWLPTLQGWHVGDYDAHVARYAANGVALEGEPLVGLGSIGTRQHDPEVGRIARHLAAGGLALHGFGVKKTGVRLYGEVLVAADSAAWSVDARYARPGSRTLLHRAVMRMTPECEAEYRRGLHPATCTRCMRYALVWRAEVMALAAQKAHAAAHPTLFTTNDKYTGRAGAPRNNRFGLTKHPPALQTEFNLRDRDER